MTCAGGTHDLTADTHDLTADTHHLTADTHHLTLDSLIQECMCLTTLTYSRVCVTTLTYSKVCDLFKGLCLIQGFVSDNTHVFKGLATLSFFLEMTCAGASHDFT